MTDQTYLYSQAGRFYFRRRIPKISTYISPVIVSLGVKNRQQALIKSLSLTNEFETVLDAFTYITREIPEALIHRYMQVRLKQSLYEMARHDRMVWVTGRRPASSGAQHETLKYALEALLTEGPYAPFPVEHIRAEWSIDMLKSVMALYDHEAHLLKSPAIIAQLRDEFSIATQHTPKSLEHDAQIMQAYLNSRLAALTNGPWQAPEARERSITTRPVALSPPVQAPVNQPKELAKHAQPPEKTQTTDLQALPQKTYTPGVHLISSDLTTRLLTEQFEVARLCDEPLHRSPEKEPFGIDFAGACERSIKIAQNAGTMDDKTADARRSKVKLFCLLTGIQTVTEVEQFHFRIFDQRMSEVHKTFLKSPSHFDYTWNNIQNLAHSSSDDELGRAPKTFNTYLEQVSAVIKHARSNEGAQIDPTLDPSLLRRPETRRSRQKRSAFKSNELRTLFQHPVWQGCKSTTRRHEAGDVIHKDGLFFVPMIVAYSGGRMEEIAGLTVDSIVEFDGAFGLDIRPHAERRLKNLQSNRLVPLHEHLIAQGLIKHRDRMKSKGEVLLFPELRPQSKKKKFMSALRYNWEKLRTQQLAGNPKGLDGHSLRHSFNQFLKNQPNIKKEVRLDILGHAGEDLNEEVYGDEDGMPFEMKKAAIDLLSRLF